MNLDIPFEPRRWQGEMLQKFASPNWPRRNVMNIHRGGGKTHFCLVYIIMAAMATYTKNGMPAKFCYVGKSISHAKQVCWDTFKTLLRDFEHTMIPGTSTPLVSFNANDLTIKFNTNGNMIHLTGIEDPEKVRGLHVHGLILDEAQMCDDEIWQKVLSPTTRQHKAWILVIGTPNGPQGTFYRLSMEGKTDKGFWKTTTLTVNDTGEIDPEEWEELQSTTSPEAIQQEYFCSFEAAVSNRVYSSFSNNHRLRDPSVPEKDLVNYGNIDDRIKDQEGDLYVGMDFNYSHLPAVIAQQGYGGTLEIIDEIMLKNTTTDHMAAHLKIKYPGRRIYICPDASGAQRSANAVQGSNHALLKQHGLIVLSPPKNPRVEDRVQQVNVMLCDAKQRRRLFIHPRCKELIRTLSFQTMNEYTGQPDKTSGLDHMGDALGYLVNITHPVIKKVFRKKSLI